MPTKLQQFEGPVLEDVLMEAMAAAGPNGRVSNADRIRTGGIAGFFAREHFEVTVEFDDEPTRSSTTPPVQKAAAPNAAATSAATTAPPATKTAPPAPPVASPPPAPAPKPRPQAAPTWDALADDTEDVLELSGTSDGDAPSSSPSPSVAPSTSTSDTEEHNPTIGDLTSLAPSAGVPSTERTSFASVLAGIDTQNLFGDEAGDSASPAAVDPAPSIVPLRATALVTIKPTTATSKTGAWVEAVTGDTHPSFTDLVAVEDGNPVTDSSVAPSLAAVGLPAAFLPDPEVLRCLDTLSKSEDGKAYVQLALVSALHRLPEPPPLLNGPGSLLVVVGRFDRAVNFAKSLAKDFGMPQDQVIIASAEHDQTFGDSQPIIRTFESAQQIAARSRRNAGATLVALDAPVSADANAWVCRMIEAFEPTAVWGVAGATHKSEDLAAWADGLGGLDALALQDITSTTSPAQALGAGIPVASLDGRRATPALWAAVIAGRLLLECAGDSAVVKDRIAS